MLGIAKPAPNSSTLQPARQCRTDHKYSASNSDAPTATTEAADTRRRMERMPEN